MKKLLPLLLAAMLLLTACQGGAPAGGETPAESGRPQQEETGAGSRAQTGETNAGAQSPQPEETGPAEEPEETGSGPVSGEETGGQTRPAVPALSAQSLAAIEKITYYGDRSRCAMTREQLVAYAQFALNYEENDIFHEEGRLSYAFLADFDGNGNPYLVFVHPAPGPRVSSDTSLLARFSALHPGAALPRPAHYYAFFPRHATPFCCDSYTSR